MPERLALMDKVQPVLRQPTMDKVSGAKIAHWRSSEPLDAQSEVLRDAELLATQFVDKQSGALDCLQSAITNSWNLKLLLLPADPRLRL